MKRFVSVSVACGLAVSMFALEAIRGAEAIPPVTTIPPIKEITKLAPKENAFKRGRPPQPTVLKSEKEAAEYFGEEALAQIKKEVDFSQQVLLLFAWRGSGQDRLTYVVKESFPEQIAFHYKAGLTRDLRPHVRVYALRSDVKWSGAGAPPKPKVAKPAGGEVSWDEMKALIQKGDVREVMQTHSRRVTAIMADGTRYEATEPALDDIVKLIRETKKDIPIATE